MSWNLFHIKLDDKDSLIGFATGAIGGGLKYVLNVNSFEFLSKLSEAGITAIVCGFLGVAGKHIFTYLEQKVSKLIKKNKNKNDEQTLNG